MNTLHPPATASDGCAYCGAPTSIGLLHPGTDHTATVPRYCCYGCRVLGEAGEKPVAETAPMATPWFRVGIGATIAGQAMLLGLGVNLAQPTGAVRWLLHLALIASAMGVSAILGGPLVRSALDSLRARQVSVDFLFLAGIWGAFLGSLVSTLSGQGAIYYEVVAVLLTVYAAGKTLGAQSRARALAEAFQLRNAFETCRRLRADGRTEQVPAGSVEKGDRIQVLAGEAISVDGEIERGQAFVSETPLTGEPFPVVRRAGDRISAGSYSEDGELLVQATVNGRERRLEALLAQVESARQKPTLLQAQADRVVRWFLPLVLLVSAVTFVVWTLRSGWAAGLFNAMAVLLVACPCAMGLATPMALWNALAVMAARGFVARNGDIIQKLAEVRHVAFDKTGTLSEERTTLVDLVTVSDSHVRQELLAVLRAVQSRSPHPVARAFESLPTPEIEGLLVKSVKTLPGRGIESWVQLPDGREWHLRIGNRELVKHFGNEPKLLDQLRHRPKDALIYVETDGQLAAVASIHERLRDSATATIEQLGDLHMGWSLLTGDRKERALALGFKNVHGSLTPEEKVTHIRKLKAEGGVVAFVGDGINDALAMQAADVSISLEHGAGLTVANSDAVLYGGDLRNIPGLIVLCRQVRDTLRSNLLFAAVYNLIGICLAASGLLHPVVSALLMVTSSAIVSWRALAVTRHVPGCCGAPDSGRHNSTDLSVQLPETAPPRHNLTPRSNWSFSLMLIAQGPFIAWFGQLSFFWSVLVVLGCGAAGFGIAKFRSENAEVQRYAQMTFAMLGAGNWGMLLGWWAESGFGTFSPMASCCCHQADAPLASAGIQIPWMYVGMVLFGTPPMLRNEYLGASAWLRWSLGALSAVGMVLGMMAGASVAERLNPSGASSAFLVLLICMTVGMLLGMFFCCELGRALALRMRYGRSVTQPRWKRSTSRTGNSARAA